MKKYLTKRLLALVLAFVMCLGLALPAGAAQAAPDGSKVIVEKVDNSAVSATLNGLKEAPVKADDKPAYGENETVRVSIILSDKPALEIAKANGISTLEIADSATVMSYRTKLADKQLSVADKISAQVLGGEKLDVVWNLTLVGNIISANVKYGQIEAISKVAGVKEVIIENQYQPDVVTKGDADPNMATSAEQIGSTLAYLEGYTGAGSRIAIIDTGTDYTHQSFDNDAFEYALQVNAEAAGMSYEEYVESLDLLDVEEIASVLDQLHAAKRYPGLTAEDLYDGLKLAYGFNYVDYNLNMTHYNSEHGSHVAGIATANRFIKTSEGVFESALETVYTQGVAPDAQLITMKVFGSSGGAYDSDYMVAIEDAIVLGADSVNLSLGSGNPGFTFSDSYQHILDSLTETDTVVVMSAGNSGYWVEATANGIPYLYADDVSFHTGGSPGTYTNSLGVASVDNSGYTTLCVEVGGSNVTYVENAEYGNAPIVTIAGDHEYVMIPGIGTPEDFAALGEGALEGKIAICYRGTTSFFEKANAAVEAGAIGVIIVNNQDGAFGANLTGYLYSAPVITVTQAEGEYFKVGGTAVTDGDGNVLYWTGTLTVNDGPSVGQYGDSYYTMSSFSSWGVPGDLSMKPEITAPGGSIYSVYGTVVSENLGGSDQYVLMSGTSMAAPQVTGMMAILMQYIRENDLSVDGLTDRALAQSLLMSTAEPMIDGNGGGYYYPVLQQGAGLANIGAAVKANSYILMGDDATDSAADGKVKVELGDDPAKTGYYEFTFSINNLTNVAQSYKLSADFFTQGLFAYGGELYLDTWTVPVNAVVAWLFDGQTVDSSLDFDGDGLLTSADGQLLLDYVAGMDVEVSNIDAADLDQDGDVDSHDAYLCLEAMSVVEVPANGSVEITAQVQLNDSWLDYYENGAYVEGYVYAANLATEEGVAGETHSIPVLGFYGNWTDASMYDVGSLAEYWYGTESRYPYLPDSDGYPEMFTNYMTIKYAGDSSGYFFFGNPLTDDDGYYPERQALNNTNGDALYKLYFAPIRNAGNALFLLSDAETGAIYAAQQLGAVNGAYYHVNKGAWQQTALSLTMGFTGAGLPENTKLNVSLVLIPECYASADGSYNLGAILGQLGEGAFLTTPVTIDNTAPVLDEESVVIDEENGTLTLTITDNQYVAAVALYDVYGEYNYTYEGSMSDVEAGETVEYVLDLSDVNGPSFLLQVYDYAMNATTYKITQQIGEVTETIESVELSATSAVLQKSNTLPLTAIVYPVNAISRGVVWSSSDESVVTVDENGVVTAVGAGYATVTAAAEADPSVYAVCDIEVIDINVDLNGIVWDEEGSIWFSSFNTAGLPEYTKLSADMLGVDYFTSAAVGADGTIYASTLNTSTGTGSLYTIDPVTYEATLLAPCSVQGIDIFYSDLTYVPAMFGTGVLLGSYGPYVIAIDPASGTALGIIDDYSDLGGEIVGIAGCYGMYDPEYGEYQDVVYVIMNNGIVAQEIYYGYDYMVVPMMYYFYGFRATMETGISKGSAWYFNSAYYDGTYLYWSAFDQKSENAVTLYAIDADYTGSVYSLGQFADGVWPVSGLYQAPAAEADAEAAAKLAELAAAVEGMPIETQDYVLEVIEWVGETPDVGGLNSTVTKEAPAHPETEDEEVVTVTVTAKNTYGNDTGSVNGLEVITYDSTEMTVADITVFAQYSSVVVDEENGTVTVAYVDLSGIAAGSAVAVVKFDTAHTADHYVTVESKEVNNQHPGYVESFTIAYEHVFGDWYVAESTAAGQTMRHDCELCDEYETMIIPGAPAPSAPEDPVDPVDPVDPEDPEDPEDPVVENPFTDVVEGEYYTEAVLWAVENGITTGTSEDTFSPNDECTRGQIVTFLWRAAGCPVVETENVFVDVVEGEYYYDAVLWAVENGITNGTGADTFSPNATCTRAQVVTFLWRAAGCPVVETENAFVDVVEGTYYYNAVLWAVENGITNGTGADTFSPNAICVRGQIVTFMYRAAEK